MMFQVLIMIKNSLSTLIKNIILESLHHMQGTPTNNAIKSKI